MSAVSEHGDEITPMGSFEPEGGEANATGSQWRVMLRTFLANKLALVGFGILIVIVLFCFVGPLLYRTDQIHTRILEANLGPSKTHPLGTTYIGYDELGRLMAGGQTSIEVGLSAAVAATVFGVIWGAASGYIGGVVDSAMMRIVDIFFSIPIVLVLLMLATIITPRLSTMIVLLALFSWLIPARLVRGEALTLRTRDYVHAAQAMGGSASRTIFRHIIPNAMGVIVVQATFQIANIILIFAILSYLGFGLPPPIASWGGMLSDGTTFIADGYWWQIYPPGVAIVLIVIAFNFIGDALRDALDVRLQQR